MSHTVLRVGLTGNIASGKSTLAGWLLDLGCHVVDLDAVGHACLQPGEPTYDAVIAAFGGELAAADGTIDRAELGAIVFADDSARKVLENILHPAIRERENLMVEAIAESGEPAIVVTGAALLYEAGGATRYDRMVVVTAPDELRLQRLQARGLTADDARRRMASQMDQQRKAELADYIIANDGSFEETRAKVEVLAARLRGDLHDLMAGRPLARPSKID